MSDRFSELDKTLDFESWEWLSDNYPPIASAVKAAVDKGAQPTEIRARVLERLGAHRVELAQRCENASRYLASQKQTA